MEALLVLAIASNLEVSQAARHGSRWVEFFVIFGGSFLFTIAILWLMLDRPKFWTREWWNS